MSDYAIITFWDKTLADRHQVMQSKFVPNALSRVVNAENDLHEIIFEAYNIQMPFLFSFKPESEEHSSSSTAGQMLLNLLGEPDPSKLDKQHAMMR